MKKITYIITDSQGRLVNEVESKEEAKWYEANYGYKSEKKVKKIDGLFKSIGKAIGIVYNQ